MVTNVCLVCGSREGTIRTHDGPVCGDCIPYDLLSQADRIGRQRIVIYRRTHPGCRTCSEQRQPIFGPNVSDVLVG